MSRQPALILRCAERLTPDGRGPPAGIRRVRRSSSLRTAASRARRSSAPAPTTSASTPYPTEKGHIVEGLTKDDFEKSTKTASPRRSRARNSSPSTLWTPEAERKNPRTQQDAYDLAADPTWRIFVIVLESLGLQLQGRHYMRAPLHEVHRSQPRPQDLFACLTTERRMERLVLGRRRPPPTRLSTAAEWI
jgi:hypothetical protein